MTKKHNAFATALIAVTLVTIVVLAATAVEFTNHFRILQTPQRQFELLRAGIPLVFVDDGPNDTWIVTVTTNASKSIIVNDQRKPWPHMKHFFGEAHFFDDLQVYETVTRRQFTIPEVMDMIDKLPNVKTVRLGGVERRMFKAETLAYPQYAHDYELTREEWVSLQELCREKLNDPIAVDEVLQHWKSIVAGTPPFGLKVQP